MNPNYNSIVNELREPLKKYGILADDLGMKTLNKCKPILEAIEAIQNEKKACEDKLISLEINFSTIAGRTGIDRKSLAENDVYRKIIMTVKTSREAYADKTITTLTTELERYKRMETDVESIKQAQMDLNRKYALSEREKYDLSREWEITKSSLQQANEKVLKLEKENIELRNIVNSYNIYPKALN